MTCYPNRVLNSLEPLPPMKIFEPPKERSIKPDTAYTSTKKANIP